MTSPAFLLGPLAAASCPVKTQNSFNPLLEYARTGRPPVSSLAGETHRTQVFEYLIARHGDLVRDLRGVVDSQARAKACLKAMGDGVAIILDAELPPDYDNHRSGVADVLLRSEDETQVGYYPALIRSHNILAGISEGEDAQLVSCLAKPFKDDAHREGFRYRGNTQSADMLHLAHLWYLLNAAGFASQPWAANIGLDQYHPGHCCAIAWVDLRAKQLRAFSHTADQRWKKYAPLSRYQHEHRFRVRVATHALAQTHPEDPAELVASPVKIDECATCEWWPSCEPHLVDDISVKIERSPLDAREIMSLRTLGVSTIADLADADLETLLPSYLPMVSHRSGAETRLRLAAHRGRLMVEGVSLERLTTGEIEMPSAPVEIDIDIETSASNYAYLWGFLVHDTRTGSPPTYHCVSQFTEMTPRRELKLADEAARWLKALVDSLGDVPVVVWHYSNYETLTINRLARVGGFGALAWLQGYVQKSFVDLLPVVRQHFFGVDGLGLKVVASSGAGFSWRDVDPSGLNSQTWAHDAIHAPTVELRQAAKRRTLEYNEDDVRATWALRNWMRTLT